ncbi:uncharacterized protein LOC144349469 [Saccoglossus kowalevskii]
MATKTVTEYEYCTNHAVLNQSKTTTGSNYSGIITGDNFFGENDLVIDGGRGSDMATKIIIPLIVAAILIGGYIGVKHHRKRQQKKKREAERKKQSSKKKSASGSRTRPPRVLKNSSRKK